MTLATRRSALAAALSVSIVAGTFAGTVQAATQWDVSLWGQRRAWA